MTDEEKYAVLAEASYRYKDELDNKLAKGYTQKHIQEYYGLTNYDIDEELSDRNSIVVIDKPNNEIVISYRGTDPNEMSDLVSDLHILAGTSHLSGRFEPERFALAEQKYQQTLAKYQDAEIKTSGHSLGAHQSLMIARKHGLEGHHYNTGASVADALIQTTDFLKCSIVDCPTSKKQTLYTTGNDPISILMLPRLTNAFGKQNVVFRRKGDLDLLNHSLGHFLPDANPRHPIYPTEKAIDPIKYHILDIRFGNKIYDELEAYPWCKKKKYKRRHTRSDFVKDVWR